MNQEIFTKRFKPFTGSHQQGGILIESLIGMLILGLIGGGIMHSTARMTVAQHDLAVQTIAVSQMRTALMTGTSDGADLCDGAAPTVTLPGSTTPVSVTVKNCAAKEMTITSAAFGTQKVTTMQPRILEVGSGSDLVRVGGNVNAAL